MVRFLVGVKCRMEACLAERCDDASLSVYAVVIACIDSRKKHRYALVCSVRLCEHVVESRQSGLAGHERRGVAPVAIDSEVGGTRRLAYDKYIHLAAVRGMGSRGIERESG